MAIRSGQRTEPGARIAIALCGTPPIAAAGATMSRSVGAPYVSGAASSGTPIRIQSRSANAPSSFERPKKRIVIVWSPASTDMAVVPVNAVLISARPKVSVPSG